MKTESECSQLEHNLSKCLKLLISQYARRISNRQVQQNEKRRKWLLTFRNLLFIQKLEKDSQVSQGFDEEQVSKCQLPFPSMILILPVISQCQEKKLRSLSAKRRSALFQLEPRITKNIAVPTFQHVHR